MHNAHVILLLPAIIYSTLKKINVVDTQKKIHATPLVEVKVENLCILIKPNPT